MDKKNLIDKFIQKVQNNNNKKPGSNRQANKPTFNINKYIRNDKPVSNITVVRCSNCGRKYELKTTKKHNRYLCSDCVESMPKIDFYSNVKTEWYLKVNQHKTTKPKLVENRRVKDSAIRELRKIAKSKK